MRFLGLLFLRSPSQWWTSSGTLRAPQRPQQWTCEHAPEGICSAGLEELVPAPRRQPFLMLRRSMSKHFCYRCGGDHPAGRCPTRPRRHSPGWRQRERRRPRTRRLPLHLLRRPRNRRRPPPPPRPRRHRPPIQPRRVLPALQQPQARPHRTRVPSTARSSAFRRVNRGDGGQSRTATRTVTIPAMREKNRQAL